MDRRQVDAVEASFFFGNTEGKKKIDVGRIGRNSVLGQSPLGDKIAKIQLESCGELLWKWNGFDGASLISDGSVCERQRTVLEPDVIGL